VVLDDSLEFFTEYYGGVQPARARAPAFRLDLFTVVETLTDVNDTEMPIESLRKLHYLLYLAAVSGASERDIEVCRPEAETLGLGEKFLGLEIEGADFVDYRRALRTLAKLFETEFGSFRAMAKFVRANYAAGFDGDLIG
jgi:hypothetical protein